jgi:hypothetical protein
MRSTILLLLTFGALAAQALPGAEPRVSIVTDEADAAVAILTLREQGHDVGPESWTRLWQSVGYQRLKERQDSFGRTGTDESLREFLLSAEALERADGLRDAVERWKGLDLSGAVRRAQAYLPAGLKIRATIYPVVKKATNSFVFDLGGENPAIFMYVDPSIPPEKLANTLAHELHHVGISGCPEPPGREALTPPQAKALDYLSAFGEGLAMLAAAGGPDVHPHADSPADAWVVWERDVAYFNHDVAALESFFRQILAGELSEEEARKALFSFINAEGVPQGAFYTVGWKMAAIVERVRTREALIAAMCDPRDLLVLYNEVASGHERGEGSLARWSADFLEALKNP